MWGPKCDKVQKPWLLQLKCRSLSIRLMKNEESGKDCNCKGVVTQKDKRGRTYNIHVYDLVLKGAQIGGQIFDCQ